jgi:SNF2 family DNA or RNA helicase
VQLYTSLLRSKRISSLLYGVGSSGGGDSEGVLPAITVLRKLCNHPALLRAEEPAVDAQQQQQQQASAGAGAAARGRQPPPPQQAAQAAGAKMSDVAAAVLAQHAPAAGLPLSAVELSGKLVVLCALLQGIIGSGCKVVVVSTSTAALDLVDELLCRPQA